MKVHRVHNYMENVVDDAIGKMLQKPGAGSFTEKDLADIRALTLNSLPPRYIVTAKGEMYTKLSEMSIQFQADVTRALVQAVDTVKKHPRD